jgi:hypothetical protein
MLFFSFFIWYFQINTLFLQHHYGNSERILLKKRTIMKTIKFFVTMMLLGITMGASAQMTASELNIKASKTAKKQAKVYKKQGWVVAPGAIPMEKQLDRSYVMEFDTDLDMQSKFAFGEAISTGQFYDAAKLQASEIAKSDLVGKISSEITRLVETQIKTKQIQDEQAQSIAAATEKSKSLVIQKLGAIAPVLEFHRKLKNGNVEVMIRYAYNRERAVSSAFKEIEEQLKGEGIEINFVQ